MGAWGKDQSCGDKVMMLADGSGDFTRAVGLELDARKAGLGMRSQRYSMLVEDGVVKKLNVEAARQVRGVRRRFDAEGVLTRLACSGGRRGRPRSKRRRGSVPPPGAFVYRPWRDRQRSSEPCCKTI